MTVTADIYINRYIYIKSLANGLVLAHKVQKYYENLLFNTQEDCRQLKITLGC